MQLNPESLASIYFNLRLGFDKAYESTETFALKVAMSMPSSTREQRYPWLKLIPRLREWIGERVYNNLVARSTSIVNKDWEASLSIDRNDIDDDNLGVYAPGIAMLGMQAAKWPDDRITVALQEGTTAEAFDGQSFFDTDHPIDMDKPGLGTYRNLYVGMALTFDNLAAVRQEMMLIKGEDNKPLRLMPRQLIVPPQLEFKAKQILNSTTIAPAGGFGLGSENAQDNPLKGVMDPLVIPELGDEPDVWYVADNTKPIKGIIWQLRKAPVLTSLTSPTDTNVFERKEYHYGVDSRGNHGYSLPFLMARCEA